MIKNMELAQVRRGESFILDGVKFVKLDEDAHASFVLTADVFPKHIPFEHKDAERKDHDNFVGSYLQKHVDIWLHQGHPNISKAVVERPINLLSMCGETVYGTPCVFGRVLTLDEYRRYRKYIPLASDWYWLATSYSPYSSNNGGYACGVYADGSVGGGSSGVCGGGGCARPALYLESSILVSVEVETDDIEKMQDKVTALRRETLTAKKNRRCFGLPQNNSHKNKEGYSDPTVYEALRKIDEEDARFHRLLDMIFYLCELAGFRIEGRIVLTDKRTGRIWR